MQLLKKLIIIKDYSLLFIIIIIGLPGQTPEDLILTFSQDPCHEPSQLIRQGLPDDRIWPNQAV